MNEIDEKRELYDNLVFISDDIARECDIKDEQVPIEIMTFINLKRTKGYDEITLEELKRLNIIYAIREMLDLFDYEPGDINYKRVSNMKEKINSIKALNMSFEGLEEILEACNSLYCSINRISVFPSIEHQIRAAEAFVKVQELHRDNEDNDYPRK
jgi:hypothetical protein